MYVFGSAATASFKDNSDIDFLVRFGNVEPLNYFNNYMDFKESLKALFQRTVDLIEIQTVKNPILKESIDQSKHIIYEQANSEMAV